MIELAIAGFLKEAVTGQKAKRPIQRSFVTVRGFGQFPHRTRRAGLNVIGNPEFSDRAHCPAEGRAEQDLVQLFGFLLRHSSIPERMKNPMYRVWGLAAPGRIRGGSGAIVPG